MSHKSETISYVFDKIRQHSKILPDTCLCGFLIDGQQKETHAERREKLCASTSLCQNKKVKCAFQQLFRAPQTLYVISYYGTMRHKDIRNNIMKFDRITINPNRMNGQPCIRDLRLTVRRVLEIIALYPKRTELHQEYPELEEEDIQQALAYAAASLEDRIIEFSHEIVA